MLHGGGGITTMKNTLKTLLILCGLLLAASMSFGQTILTHTTLSAAVASSSTTFITLTSATGVTANNTALFVADGLGEAMFVNSVNGSTIGVTRGYQSLGKARPHISGALVFVAPMSGGYPSAINTVAPTGSCTRTNIPYLPVISVGLGGAPALISDCLGGTWVNGNIPATGMSQTIVNSPPVGGAVLTGIGTSTTTTNTSMYCTEFDLPYSRLVTGLGWLNGTATANGHRNAILYDAAGYLLANTGSTTTTGTASQFQRIALTTSYFAVGPAVYFVCSQAQSSTDTLNLIVTADGNAGVLTQIYTGQTYGTVPATITPPTAYTTAQGPYFEIY